MAKVETVNKHAARSTAEGPHWDEELQSLLYVDIIVGGVHLWNPETNEEKSANFGDFATFVVPHKKGGLVAGVGKKMAHFDWDNPTHYKVLAEVDHGLDTRLNDGKCDPVGRIFAGTMGLETAPAVLPPHLGTLYSLDKTGKVRSHLDKLTISNGLAWTKDTRTMFFADSIPGQLFAFDYDVATGDMYKLIENANTGNLVTKWEHSDECGLLLDDKVSFDVLDQLECGLSTETNQRVVHDFTKYPEEGIPDGLTIDSDDKIWIACFSAGKVLQIDPEVGKVLTTIDFPAKRTTSCCFGGKNYDELYVTTSRTGYTDEEMAKTDPLAGSLFKVTGLGVKGLPAVSFDGN